ncbi:hypothetical protein [Mesonia sp.]|uniref:hypothetical protein n=1 Tax=Mesonia sp. TaxID=1960830 RepID=UPI00176D918D|nr:hypothetical protein [Mesonia sp.]HIB36715.1 hypothetical protein [Mesonia sp.]HIO27586.1 hypothetical protein [Flavobacteriaceae bacterium]
MKFIYLIFFFLLATSCQEEDDHAFTEVPALIASSFQLQFTNAKEIEWELLSENLYEAEFEISEVDHKALFNSKGKLLKYKYEEDFENLPKKLQHILLKNFDIKDIDELEIVKAGLQTYYQLEIDQSFTELEKVFNENGKLNTTQTFWD